MAVFSVFIENAVDVLLASNLKFQKLTVTGVEPSEYVLVLIAQHL